MEKITEQKIINANGIFDNGFLCGKSRCALYCFKKIPSAAYIGNINGEKAYAVISKAIRAPGEIHAQLPAFRWKDEEVSIQRNLPGHVE